MPSVAHLAHVVAFVGWNGLVAYRNVAPTLFHGDDQVKHVEPEEPFQKFVAIFSMAVRLLAVVVIPQVLMVTVGFILFDVKRPSPVRLQCKVSEAPFLCIRVVTRGLYPSLVRRNVRSHLKVLRDLGVDNFVVEIVTDKRLDLLDIEGLERHVKQTVVPEAYSTAAGTMNKARALQYCLEDGVNCLRDHDWVVHLDEETNITEDSMRGILNFVCRDEHQFGQGVITYAAQPLLDFDSWWTSLQNRLCTVADSVRVADDLGKHKAQFKLLHRPYFGIKGSFVVSKFGAERRVGWDFGPSGSKAEDAWMSLVALDQHFTFDFIDGDMLERSPFTLSDFFKQRKRWMQGIFMVVTTPTIRLQTRLLLGSSLASWLILPFSTAALLLQMVCPFHLPHLWMDVVLSWLEATGLYMYFIGYLRQFPINRMSWTRIFALMIPEILVASVVALVVENLAVMFMWFGDWYSFHIVQKEVPDRKVGKNVMREEPPSGSETFIKKPLVHLV